jgi:hypothetical protein
MRTKVVEVITRVRELARQYPDAVYQRPEWPDGDSEACSYFKGSVSGTNLQGCLFGQPLGEFGILEKDISRSVSNVLQDQSWDTPNLPFSQQEKDLLHWCDIVQEYQDDGTSWGRAVELADKQMEGLV